jgi:hypothetical protein
LNRRGCVSKPTVVAVIEASSSDTTSRPFTRIRVILPLHWIQAADQYVVLHVGPKEYLLREPLHRLASGQPGNRFAQPHRSHVVNLARVREVTHLLQEMRRCS